MERTWAAIDGGVITNTFVGGDDFADLVRPDHDDVLEITGISPMPGMNWTVEAEGYRPPSPYPSWVWDVDHWRAPVPYPDAPGSWVWEDTAQKWVDTTPPGA